MLNIVKNGNQTTTFEELAIGDIFTVMYGDGTVYMRTDTIFVDDGLYQDRNFYNAVNLSDAGKMTWFDDGDAVTVFKNCTLDVK